MAGMLTFHAQDGRLDLCPCGNGFIAPIENGIDAFVRGIGRDVPTAVLSRLCPMTRKPGSIPLLKPWASEFQVINDILFTGEGSQ